jgi:hypothetical protein
MSSKTIDRTPGLERADVPARRSRLTVSLLACGIAYSVLFVIANDMVAASRYPGYSRMSQAISELSATGAPTRAFLTATLPIFAALLVAFGLGVRMAAHGKRTLHVTGDLLIAFGLMGVLWLFFPMTSRADMIAGTVQANDLGHIGLTVATIVFILASIGFGAAALGKWFRIYSAATIVAVMLFGILTGMDAAKVSTGDPTPYMGLFERINAFGWMLWMAVFAVALIQAERRRSTN